MSAVETWLKTIPKKWWHSILMYPTLAIFILGIVPTLQQICLSSKHNVPFTKAYDAKRQGNHWERNFKDLENQKFEATLVKKNGITLDYRIFDSGDILIWASKEGELGSTHWIAFEDLVPSTLSSLYAVNEAMADRGLKDFSPADGS